MLRSTRELRDAALLCALLIPIVLGTHCSDSDDDDEGGGPPSTSYFGSFTANGGTAGTVEINQTAARSAGTTLVRASVDYVATLTASTGESTVFNGTVDDVEGFLTLVGSGGISLSGFADGPFAGGDVGAGPPFGPGKFAALAGTSGSVSVFCGEFFDDANPGVPAGRVSLVVAGGNAAATVSSQAEGSSLLDNGSISGSSVTLGQFGPGATLTATGTVSGGSVSGSWSDDGDGGTWTASTAECG